MSDATSYAQPRKTSINEDSSINEIINDTKGINSEIFNKHFGYQNLPFLAKNLIKTDQSEIKQTAKQAVNSINELRNSIIKK